MTSDPWSMIQAAGYTRYAPAVWRCYILGRARTAAGFHLRLRGRNKIALCRKQIIVAATNRERRKERKGFFG